eukprot:8781124-Pyramimonas_sp.AAC.1
MFKKHLAPTMRVVRSEVKELKETIKDVDIRITNLESNIEDMQGGFEDIQIRVTNLEHTLKKQKTANEYHYHKKGAVTAVENVDSLEAASAYIRDELNKLSGPISTNMYSKGEFKNIIFAEFTTMLDRDTAVAQLRSAKLQ